MRILIDIGHPAHVHYFKNTIRQLQVNGHKVIIISREKEITFELLNSYNIPFISRGKGKNNLLGKLYYLFIGSYIIFKVARKNKIDLYLSFASPYAAISSILYRKPNIAFDDTEHNIFNHKIYVALSKTVLTPFSFKKNFGLKQIRFKGTMESAYLHPKHFTIKQIKFSHSHIRIQNKKNVILRFVSWNASHDVNQNGFSNNDIYRLVEAIEPYANIFVTSEKEFPKNLKKYAIRINPADMHHYMRQADLFIGESGSMATEASYLGTHSIVLNSASHNFGVFEWFSKFKTFHIAKDFEDVLETTIHLLNNKNLKVEAKIESTLIQKESINLTEFIVWFIENYPKSIRIIKQNPNYQYKFK